MTDEGQIMRVPGEEIIPPQPERVPREERRELAAERLSTAKADLFNSVNAQALVSRIVEIIDAIEFAVVGVVSDGNPDVVAGTPAHLLDDPTKIRVEFTSGPGAVQQQRERDAEVRRKAAVAAEARAREVRRAAGPASWFEDVAARLGAIKSAAATSVGSITMVRDRTRELAETLAWMISTTTNAPAAKAVLLQLANDCSSAVYPGLLRDRMRTLIDYAEILLGMPVSSSEPRVDPGVPLSEIEDVARPKVVLGPVGRAEPKSTAEVALIDRNSRTIAPARVELTPTPPQNDTQRASFFDSQGRPVDENGKIIAVEPVTAGTPEPAAPVEEPPAQLVEPEVQLVEPAAVAAPVVVEVVETKPIKRDAGEGVRRWP